MGKPYTLRFSLPFLIILQEKILTSITFGRTEDKQQHTLLPTPLKGIAKTYKTESYYINYQCIH